MPFKSKAQQRFMFARHPEIAKRWEGKYGVPEDLPEKKKASPRRQGAKGKMMNRLWDMK